MTIAIMHKMDVDILWLVDTLAHCYMPPTTYIGLIGSEFITPNNTS